MPDTAAIRTQCEEYVQVLERIHGLYLDTTYGIGEVATRFMAWHTAHLASKGLGVDPATLNPRFAYLGGPEGAKQVLHQISVTDYIDRNVPDGSNWTLLAQYCLVAAYQFWEDEYRERIARATGVPKNDIRSDTFGELRRLRQAIVHNAGVATSEVAANRLLPQFAAGTPIALTPEQVNALLIALKARGPRIPRSCGLTTACS